MTDSQKDDGKQVQGDDNKDNPSQQQIEDKNLNDIQQDGENKNNQSINEQEWPDLKQNDSSKSNSDQASQSDIKKHGDRKCASQSDDCERQDEPTVKQSLSDSTLFSKQGLDTETQGKDREKSLKDSLKDKVGGQQGSTQPIINEPNGGHVQAEGDHDTSPQAAQGGTDGIPPGESAQATEQKQNVEGGAPDTNRSGSPELLHQGSMQRKNSKEGEEEAKEEGGSVQGPGSTGEQPQNVTSEPGQSGSTGSENGEKGEEEAEKGKDNAQDSGGTEEDEGTGLRDNAGLPKGAPKGDDAATVNPGTGADTGNLAAVSTQPSKESQEKPPESDGGASGPGTTQGKHESGIRCSGSVGSHETGAGRGGGPRRQGEAADRGPAVAEPGEQSGTGGGNPAGDPPVPPGGAPPTDSTPTTADVVKDRPWDRAPEPPAAGPQAAAEHAGGGALQDQDTAGRKGSREEDVDAVGQGQDTSEQSVDTSGAAKGQLGRNPEEMQQSSQDAPLKDETQSCGGQPTNATKENPTAAPSGERGGANEHGVADGVAKNASGDNIEEHPTTESQKVVENADNNTTRDQNTMGEKASHEKDKSLENREQDANRDGSLTKLKKPGEKLQETSPENENSGKTMQNKHESNTHDLEYMENHEAGVTHIENQQTPKEAVETPHNAEITTNQVRQQDNAATEDQLTRDLEKKQQNGQNLLEKNNKQASSEKPKDAVPKNLTETSPRQQDSNDGKSKTVETSASPENILPTNGVPPANGTANTSKDHTERTLAANLQAPAEHPSSKVPQHQGAAGGGTTTRLGQDGGSTLDTGGGGVRPPQGPADGQGDDGLQRNDMVLSSVAPDTAEREATESVLRSLNESCLPELREGVERLLEFRRQVEGDNARLDGEIEAQKEEVRRLVERQAELTLENKRLQDTCQQLAAGGAVQNELIARLSLTVSRARDGDLPAGAASRLGGVGSAQSQVLVAQAQAMQLKCAQLDEECAQLTRRQADLTEQIAKHQQTQREHTMVFVGVAIICLLFGLLVR